MMRPIAISLSPNTQVDDFFLAFRTFVNPLSFLGNLQTNKLESSLARMLGKGFNVVALDAGRSAFFVILQALGIGKEHTVCIQALTCVAVPNAIMWAGASVSYVDIDNSFNMDPNDLASKITAKTKAVVIQHTFGIPANVAAIAQVVKRAEEKFGKKIFIIEDCAHALGATIGIRKVGTFGDASFFSFGRDKVISSVFGGAVATRNPAIFTAIVKQTSKLSLPSIFWQIRQLLHPILFHLTVLPFYFLGVGKVTLGKLALFLLQKIGILSLPVSPEEKQGKRPQSLAKRMPNALAVLAIGQLGKLEKFNSNRKHLAKFYQKNLVGTHFKFLQKVGSGTIWLRFPVLTDKPKKLLNYARKSHILLGNWYDSPVTPAPSLATVGYRWGSCKKAESVARRIINLPTYPELSQKDAQSVVDILKTWQNL